MAHQDWGQREIRFDLRLSGVAIRFCHVYWAGLSVEPRIVLLQNPDPFVRRIFDS